MIRDQVKLPIRVAFAVVLQGIRIRFGRSLITIGGVVLGIAFLMSNLSGQVIKEAVQDEVRAQTEVRRMASFLEAEMGPPLDRTIGVVQTGALDETEVRLVQGLIEGGLETLRWHRASAGMLVPAFTGLSPSLAELDDTGKDASAVLVLGAGTLPEPLADPAARARVFGQARGKILALTRAGTKLEAADVAVVALARDLTPDEIAQANKDKRNARFRSAWIILISLVVTVAGISNAMLMSVTERFREIGTMKCLGALSSFIRWVFFVESGLIGLAGGIAGACAGTFFSMTVYGLAYGFGLMLTSVDLVQLSIYVLLSVVMGVVLSVIAAIYPATVAASMVPAHALATNV